MCVFYIPHFQDTLKKQKGERFLSVPSKMRTTQYKLRSLKNKIKWDKTWDNKWDVVCERHTVTQQEVGRNLNSHWVCQHHGLRRVPNLLLAKQVDPIWCWLLKICVSLKMNWSWGTVTLPDQSNSLAPVPCPSAGLSCPSPNTHCMAVVVWPYCSRQPRTRRGREIAWCSVLNPWLVHLSMKHARYLFGLWRYTKWRVNVSLLVHVYGEGRWGGHSI